LDNLSYESNERTNGWRTDGHKAVCKQLCKRSNILKDWKLRIGIPNVQELRDFAILVKKSDISIEQCAEGYRMKNLMNNLGITDDFNDTKVVADGVGSSSSSSSNINILGRIRYNEFSSFVKEIYVNCKNYGIKPDIIFSWISDLFSWYSPSYNSSSSFINKQKIEVGREDKSGTFDIKTPVPFLGETESRPNSNLDNTIINSDSESEATINHITYELNPKQYGSGSLAYQVLFISQISNYIAKKKSV
jgi:hypothetical protein